MGKGNLFFFLNEEIGAISAIFCQFCRMSLFKKWKIGSKAQVGIWHITETLEQLIQTVQLPREDLKAIDHFTYEHRKKEWLTARILAGQLSSDTNTRIVYDAHNKPFLKDSGTQISLSHSHDLLAVILDEASTGIDIEVIKDKVKRIKHKFMSSEEMDHLQKETETEQLTVNWCAKESLYKLYGKKELAFKENLFIEPFRYSEKGNLKGWIKNKGISTLYNLHYEKLQCAGENYMLAYVLNKD